MNQVWLGTQKDCLGKTIMKIFILRDPRNGITAHLAKSYREISIVGQETEGARGNVGL